MEFRSATNHDIPNISALVSSVLETYGLKFDSLETDADLSDLVANYFDKGGAFEVLVLNDDQIVGTYGLYPLGENKCELRKMYLTPNLRGRGLGKKILEKALDKARSLGFSRVTLETASVLKEAISIYEKFGFRPFKTDHLSARCDQAYYLDI